MLPHVALSVFIDTSGISHQNKPQSQALQFFLEAAERIGAFEGAALGLRVMRVTPVNPNSKKGWEENPLLSSWPPKKVFGTKPGRVCPKSTLRNRLILDGFTGSLSRLN